MQLSGSLVLAVGLWLRFDSGTASLLSDRVYILIGAGGLMVLVGFFGCFGAVRESQCLLGSFFACLLLIFGAEVAAGVFGFLNKDQIIKDVQNYYESAMLNGTDVTFTYHTVLDCCGTESSRPEPCTTDSP
ncbi:hypothetical protein DNTS_029577, partial [Danionella cerebrum]